jgi:carboxylesterase type B
VIGQSAGGVSTTLQFYSPKPLFRRAAAIGGTSILMGPQPIQFHDMFYPRLLSTLGIDASLNVEEKIQLLKAIPENVWSTLPPTIPSRPVLDGDFISEIPSFKTLLDPSHLEGKPSWLESVMLTESEADVASSLSPLIEGPYPPVWISSS